MHVVGSLQGKGSCYALLMILCGILTLRRPAAFGDFLKKNCLNARGFVWEYLSSCSGYGPS